MTVKMNYGQEGLMLELPDEWNVRVVTKPAMPVLEDPEEAIAQALNHGIESPSLQELARRSCPGKETGQKTACIAICDITRPVPNGLILPILLSELEKAGIECRNICILIATGLHRPNLGEELRRVIGNDEIVERYRIENHYATRSEEHRFFPDTRQGTPVGIDSRFTDAELKIVLGLVEPHFMAGFSGGRKLVAPGIAHESTIRTFHNARFMGNERACNLNLDGNPLHREQLEILQHLGPVYGINVVLDEERRLSAVNFGEVVAGHLAIIESCRHFFRVPLERPYQTIITSAAGYPLDLTFYQVVKGLVGAKAALREGGDALIVIVARCAEGLGSPDFHRSQQRLKELGVNGFLAEIRARELAGIDEWETQKLTEMLGRARILLHAPEWNDESRALSCVEDSEDVVEDLSHWLEQSESRDVLVIPDGPYVIPVVSSL